MSADPCWAEWIEKDAVKWHEADFDPAIHIVTVCMDYWSRSILQHRYFHLYWFKIHIWRVTIYRAIGQIHATRTNPICQLGRHGWSGLKGLFLCCIALWLNILVSQYHYQRQPVVVGIGKEKSWDQRYQSRSYWRTEVNRSSLASISITGTDYSTVNRK